MNIYDLPIPNFGELNDESALKLILEVRRRRRISLPREIKVKEPSARKVQKKSANSVLRGLTREQIQELLDKLRA
jgi:hypothetical protein